MIKTIKFSKEYNSGTYRWYAVLPEWLGSKDELEMVMGADTMLDYLSEGEYCVDLQLSTEEPNKYKYRLEFINEIYDGALYELVGQNIDRFEVWLCSVTKFVFGEYPQNIYIN